MFYNNWGNLLEEGPLLASSRSSKPGNSTLSQRWVNDMDPACFCELRNRIIPSSSYTTNNHVAVMGEYIISHRYRSTFIKHQNEDNQGLGVNMAWLLVQDELVWVQKLLTSCDFPVPYWWCEKQKKPSNEQLFCRQKCIVNERGLRRMVQADIKASVTQITTLYNRDEQKNISTGSDVPLVSAKNRWRWTVYRWSDR